MLSRLHLYGGLFGVLAIAFILIDSGVVPTSEAVKFAVALVLFADMILLAFEILGIRSWQEIGRSFTKLILLAAGLTALSAVPAIMFAQGGVWQVAAAIVFIVGIFLFFRWLYPKRSQPAKPVRKKR